MTRPTKYGTINVQIGLRVPKHLLKKAKQDNLDLGNFLKLKLEEKYYPVTPISVISSFIDKDLLNTIADNRGLYDSIFHGTKGAVDWKDYLPDNKEICSFTKELTGKDYTKGAVRRGYNVVRNQTL